jgi:hypothetical protein
MRLVHPILIGVVVCVSVAEAAFAEKFAVIVSPTNTHGISVLTQNEEDGGVYCRVTIPKDVRFLEETPDAYLVSKGEHSFNIPVKVVVERKGDRTITFRLSPKLLETSVVYMSSGELASATYVLTLKDFRPKPKQD